MRPSPAAMLAIPDEELDTYLHRVAGALEAGRLGFPQRGLAMLLEGLDAVQQTQPPWMVPLVYLYERSVMQYAREWLAE